MGCPKREAPDASKETPTAETLPEIRVDRSRTDLVFTFLDPKSGQFKSVTRIDEVPKDRRQNVVVVDLSLSPEARGAGRYVALADLTQQKPDGSYPVAIASRFGFEARVTGSSTSTAARSPTREVVLYSASWCGVCKKARRFLDEKGVRYVEKDIEASRSAAEELADKARQAGVQPGGVPVIDVGGVLLQGFEAASLERLLKERDFL